MLSAQFEVDYMPAVIEQSRCAPVSTPTGAGEQYKMRDLWEYRGMAAP